MHALLLSSKERRRQASALIIRCEPAFFIVEGSSKHAALLWRQTRLKRQQSVYGFQCFRKIYYSSLQPTAAAAMPAGTALGTVAGSSSRNVGYRTRYGKAWAGLGRSRDKCKGATGLRMIVSTRLWNQRHVGYGEQGIIAPLQTQDAWSGRPGLRPVCATCSEQAVM